MKEKTILVIDGNTESRNILKNLLAENLFVVRDADTGNKALHRISSCNIDLVLLDTRLPDIYGIELCKCILEIKPDLPIIFVSYTIDEVEPILCLEAGACDYIEKPYSPDVLLARINSIFKAKESTFFLKISYKNLRLDTNIKINNYTTVKFGNWIYYPKKLSFTYLDYPEKHLTQFENKILNLLLSNFGHVCSRAGIAKHLKMVENQNTKQNINIHVYYLRKKLTQLHNSVSPIKSVQSKGYTMDSFLDYYYDNDKTYCL